MEGVAIEVRMNEYTTRDANPHVPWSPEEMAADAAACAEAGAAIVHFHARDPGTGSPSTDAFLYGDTVRRIRAAGDLVVMPTLGANTLPDPADRVAPLLAISEDPETRPDLLPIDLGSFNLDPYDAANRRFRAEGLVYHNPVSALRYLAEVIVKAGVRPAAVLWSIGSARLLGAFIEMGVLAEPVYAELTLSETLLATHPGTVRGLQALVDFLPAGMRGEWSVLSVGGSLLPLVQAAVEAGGHLALGLGDYHYRELGTPTNAELVVEVVGILRSLGRRPATPGEVRAALALP
ncbi:MAG TPA: 3-keto-5-aminohexanoate cleavage protein [Acidimicrobiales bacterium]